MNVNRPLNLIIILILTLGTAGSFVTTAASPLNPQPTLADDPSPPAEPVKLVFVHHSVGENWLSDGDGGLGLALRDANYFVSDTNYGWGPDGIGNLTDIGHWWTWFRGANSPAYMSALYTEYGQNSSYSRMATDPGGENEIIMFKSCYPNSHLGGDPTDPPTTGSNSLRGHDAYDDSIHTVANAKGIYNDILEYFETRQDKLYIVITAPPLQSSETDASHAANARALNDWLVNDWLDSYAYDNVAVFDFYNVLTSNGGDPNTNDAGTEDGNHHRWWNGAVQHIQTVSDDTSAYPGGAGGGSHPTAAGNQKATAEFVDLLNVYYNRWQGGTPPAPTLTLIAPNGGEDWVVGSQHQIQWTSTGTIANVSLAYSIDGFGTSHTIEASTANDGSYTWTISDAPSPSVRVRVASVVSPTTVYDDSDADFTISEASGETYTFNAVIAPDDATEPIAYTWSPEPDSGQGTARATYQWDSGTHVIGVAATNCGGTVNDTYTYTVGTPPACRYPLTGVSISDATAAANDATAQTTMIFQDGVHPDAGYAGTRDVILASDAQPNANVGGLGNLETYYADDEYRRSLMRWDLSALPDGVTIRGATVELYRHGGGADNPTQLGLYRVTSEWIEGTGYDFWPDPTYVPDGATWSTADGSTPWTTPGGDFDATALDQLTLPAGTGRGWVRLDATDVVQSWSAGSAQNDGLLLRPLSGEWTLHYFHSHEAITPTLRPRLVVTYTSDAPPDQHAVYLPIVLRNYTPPSGCTPLTGVSIEPAASSAVEHAKEGRLRVSSATKKDSHPFDFGPPADAGVRHRNLEADAAEAAATIHAAQPTDLTAFHRSGQTFLTWTKDTALSGESYHVYRHTAPIDASTIGSATRLTGKWGPLPEGSSIFYTDRDREPGGSAFTGLQNYVITDLGPELDDATGLFVWTSEEAGDFYYAVTTVEGGVEDRTNFGAGNSLVSPVAETISDPEPVLVWESSSGNGRVYTQFMDWATFNPTFERPYDHPDGGLQYAYNYFVGLPTTDQCGGALPGSLPIILHIEGHGSRYINGPGLGNNSSYFCALEIWGDSPRQAWYYGFSASYDYRDGYEYPNMPDAGPIVNYAEARLLRSIYDTLRDPDYDAYNLDDRRIYVYGHSMGGSGALALAMRYPNVFAASFSSEPMTNYSTSGGGEAVVDWTKECQAKWGSIGANYPISNVGRYADHLAVYNGTGVWDWQNHQDNLVSRSGDEMAHISLAHGSRDHVIEWSTQAQPAYAAFYEGTRAFSSETVDLDHTWTNFVGLGPTVGNTGDGPFHGFRVVRDETLPGLSNASGSSAVPPSGAGAEYNMNLEWSASWNDWDGAPIDTAGEWRISLRTTDGSDQTVDVTPRRVQYFALTPSGVYTWENRLVSDDSLVASGTATANAAGVVTVPDVAVSSGGNRLSLKPSGGDFYTFDAVVTPSNATTPITYTWSSTGLVGGQGTASASFQWDTPGVYTITLSAENCGGEVFQDIHTVTVDGSR